MKVLPILLSPVLPQRLSEVMSLSLCRQASTFCDAVNCECLKWKITCHCLWGAMGRPKCPTVTTSHLWR